MAKFNVVESETEDGAYPYDSYTDNEDEIIPDHCLFHNYREVQTKVNHLVKRSYERPFRWYFLTFKPFNKNYEKDIDFYNRKGFDHVRKKIGKTEAMIMTKEIQASKIHINVLCCSERNLSELLHDKNTNKYHIFSEPCKDRHLVLEYILKESRTRFFHEHLDYEYSKN